MDVPPRGHFNPLRRPAGALAALLLALAFGAGAAGIIAPPAADEADAGLLLAVAGVVAVATFPFVFLLWQLRHIGYVARPGGAIARDFPTAARRTPFWLVATSVVVLGVGATFLYGLLAAVSLATIIAIFGLAALLPVLAYGYSRTMFVGPVEGMVRFRRTMLRSLIPVVAAWVLLLGVGAGQYLSHAEAAALEPLSRPAARGLEALEASDFVKYRDHLREVNQRWLRGNVWRPAAGVQVP
jgi:hypothetical protein